MHVIFQQFGIVVAHLLEVGHNPALVDRITVKPSGQLVVNSAARHVLQSSDDDLAEPAEIYSRHRFAG